MNIKNNENAGEKMWRHLMFKNLICVFVIMLLTSCSLISKPRIEQGNIVSQEMISRLHPGMSPHQVIEVMGSPVLMNILSPNRMEYVYTLKSGNEKPVEKRYSLIFQNEHLKETQWR